MGADGWVWNDAWIFAAAVIAERLERDRAAAAAVPAAGATLADVLSAAAFLSRNVPTRKELEDAIRRLEGAGLITIDDDLVGVALIGQRLWRTRPVNGLSSAVTTMLTRLSRAGGPGESAWALDDGTWNSAIREFTARLGDG